MDEAFAADVEAIRRFGAIGKPLPAFSIPAVAVASKDEALEQCSDPAWEHVTPEARNRLTEFLCMHHRDRYAEWNQITDAAKSRVVTPLVRRVWQPFATQQGLGKLGQPFATQHGLGNVFVGCVSWDVLAAIMEHEYRDCRGRPVFFLRVLEVYRAGHFPCGWSGEWPGGQLLAW